MSGAYYNEIDPIAADWLRNLIAAGHIAPGVVDTRSIEDVKPDDLRGFTQCHFFAGIGVWSYALRRAGWPDDRPIWTGSCPCQPFSAAGQGNGFADERHLWPAWFHLITQHKPAVLAGEQVASKDADPWIDLVHADLEALGYAFGAIPFPSAGVGAPHIRDRLYWMANANDGGRQRGRDAAWVKPERFRHANRLDHADHAGLEGFGRGYQTEGGRIGAVRSTAAAGELDELAEWERARRVIQLGSTRGLADADRKQRSTGESGVGNEHATGGRLEGAAEAAGLRSDLSAGPTNGYWRDADWLGCRDGKWRPVEPGTFPLANGAPARVGRLRAYGNAINAEAARVFIEAMMEAM